MWLEGDIIKEVQHKFNLCVPMSRVTGEVAPRLKWTPGFKRLLLRVTVTLP
jgi:hypothetical protein